MNKQESIKMSLYNAQIELTQGNIKQAMNFLINAIEELNHE